MLLVEVVGGALMWSETAHRVLWLWSEPDGAGQGQLLPVFCPGPASISYKVICRWLLLVLGLEVPRRGKAANQSQLPLVSGLEPRGKRYGACQGQMLLV